MTLEAAASWHLSHFLVSSEESLSPIQSKDYTVLIQRRMNFMQQRLAQAPNAKFGRNPYRWFCPPDAEGSGRCAERSISACPAEWEFGVKI